MDLEEGLRVRDNHGAIYAVETFDDDHVYFGSAEGSTYMMGRDQFERAFEVVEE